MSPTDLQRVMGWARLESKRRNLDERKVLAELRAKIIAEVLADAT